MTTTADRPARRTTVDARSETGAALLIALVALMIIGVIGATMSRNALTELELVSNMRGASKAFYAADGGTESAFHDLVVLIRARGRFPDAAELATIQPPEMTGTDFPAFAVVPEGSVRVEPLPTGFYQGLMAFTQPYSATVTSTIAAMPNATATVEMSALMDIIPIFQFAVFYENDLEVLPGPEMLLNGRVHGNHDIYLGSNSKLRIDSTLTAAGNIYNFRKDNYGATTPGDVEIMDSSETFRAMDGFDSTASDWRDGAIDRWDGTVRSVDQEARRLELAIEDSGNPHVILEPARPDDTAADRSAKLYYAAGLRIVNGHAYDGDNNVVSIVDPISGDSAISTTRFRDHREGRIMATIELDVVKLGRSPGFPANGVVYVGGFEPVNGMPPWTGAVPWAGHDAPWDPHPDTELAVKITAGDELPTALTIVSENPVYVHGDYNVIDKKPAAVIGDAITVLSERWGDVDGDGDFDSDWDYSELSLNDRRAWSTTVNAAFLLGNTTTTSGSYNGGLENLPRFLERWSGRTLTYRGSLINLFESRHADGAWHYGSPVYTAPGRDWAFDTDFLEVENLPPATPNIYSIRVTGWDRPQ